MDNQVKDADTLEISDEMLISQCLAGHKQAWETLISRYEKLIYFTAYRTGINKSEVDDVFQNVCTTWFEQLDHLRNLKSLGAWLVTTTRRECWSHWRKHNIEENELIDEYPGDESPEKLAARVEDIHIIQSAFQQLNEPCHRLLKMMYFDQHHHSYEQIANEMNMPVNSIGPTRARCLEKLKAILDKNKW